MNMPESSLQLFFENGQTKPWPEIQDKKRPQP